MSTNIKRAIHEKKKREKNTKKPPVLTTVGSKRAQARSWKDLGFYSYHEDLFIDSSTTHTLAGRARARKRELAGVLSSANHPKNKGLHHGEGGTWMSGDDQAKSWILGGIFLNLKKWIILLYIFAIKSNHAVMQTCDHPEHLSIFCLPVLVFVHVLAAAPVAAVVFVSFIECRKKDKEKHWREDSDGDNAMMTKEREVRRIILFVTGQRSCC